MQDDFEDWDDFFDDEDDDYTPTEFEQWVDNYTGDLLRTRDKLELYPETDLYAFYYNVFKPALIDIRKIAPQLLYNMWPETQNVLYPKVLENMNYHFNQVGIFSLLSLFKLKMHIQYGDDLREVYPDFKEKEKEYTKHQQSRPFWLDLQLKYPDTPQEIWDEIEEHFFDDDIDYYDQYKYLRLHQFSVPIQEILISYCPEILDYTHDQWVIFHYLLDLEYSEFRFRFDHFASAAEYNFTEEETLLPYKEFMEVLGEKMRIKNEEREREKAKENENKHSHT